MCHPCGNDSARRPGAGKSRLLLISDRSGNHWDRGSAAPGSPTTILRARTWQRYEVITAPDPGDQLIRLLPNGAIRIEGPTLSHRPLAYFATEGLVIVAHSPLEVARELARRGRRVELDAVGVWEWLLFSTPLLGRTLFEAVRQTRLGEYLELEPNTGRVRSLSTWMPRLGGQHNDSHMLERAKRVLAELVHEACPAGAYLAPLSGGLDSRFLVASLATPERQVRTFTFGSFGSAEVPLASAVAQALRLPWTGMELRPDDYLHVGRAVALESGGQLSAMHMHLFSCVQRLEPRPSELLIHGFMGDPIAGDHAHDPADQATREQVLARVLARRGVRGGPFSDLIPAPVVAQIEADLRACAQENEAHNPPALLEEYLFIVERQSMIRYLPAVLETWLPVVCPFESSRYRDFFLGLPFRMRRNRNLFFQAASALQSAVFGLPSTAGSRSVPRARAHQLHKRARGMIQLGMDLATRGRFIWFSPYNYEQHYFLTNRIHRAKIDESARQVSHGTALPCAELVRRALHWRIRRPDLAFASLSLADVLSNLRGTHNDAQSRLSSVRPP